MKISVKQATHNVGSVKLTNACHTHTASEAVQEFCRVYFPDCRLIDRLADCQGLLDPGTRSFKMNREDLNLIRRAID